MLGIVKVTNNRIEKFAEFASLMDATKHVERYGGFVYDGEYNPHLYVDGEIVTVVPKVPSTIELKEVKDSIDIAAANSYGKLNALKNMSPAEIQEWVTANVTNLTQAQDAIGTLAIGVGILARRL